MAESTVLELKQNEIGDRKQRNSNLELMRILLMLGMIAHHYVVNSGVEALYDLSSFSWDVWFLQIFGMFGKTGINCFTLLTGYFMVKSNITLKKFLKLYLEVKFYYIGCYLLFLVTGYEPFSALTLKSAVFNVLYELNWLYTGTYIVFFPVHSLPERAHGASVQEAARLSVVAWILLLYADLHLYRGRHLLLSGMDGGHVSAGRISVPVRQQAAILGIPALRGSGTCHIFGADVFFGGSHRSVGRAGRL